MGQMLKNGLGHGDHAQVCDQPHPQMIAKIVKSCMAADIDTAYSGMKVSAPDKSLAGQG